MTPGQLEWGFAMVAFRRAQRLYPEMRQWRDLFQHGALWAYRELMRRRTEKVPTAWIKIDIRWYDINPPYAIKQADQQWIEVAIASDGKLLVQDDNGCHRMIPLNHIDGMRTHEEKAK